MDLNQLITTMLPDLEKKQVALLNGELRFVHYCSARVAVSIIEKKEIWLRNASLMNDFTEIDFGISLLRQALIEEAGSKFREVLDGIFDGFSKEILDLAADWEHDWKNDSFITCISEHGSDEDRDGRLSMWRAYGDIALVLKDTPFKAETDELGAYSLPVQYVAEEEFDAVIGRWADSIGQYRPGLEKIGRDALKSWMFEFFTIVVLGTKHFGFREEREWRVYHRPNQRGSNVIKESLVVLDDGPQIVYKIPLKDEPENGLFGADIPSLLEKVIIGPIENPVTTGRTFERLLNTAGVDDAGSKIQYSGIPLRSY